MLALNRTTANQGHPYPARILQFGAGNFLRAFVDWMIDILNDQTDFNGSVVVVKPTDKGNYQLLRQQEGLFHVDLNGIQNGQMRPEAEVFEVLPETPESLHDLAELGQQDLAEQLRAWQQAQTARLKHLQFQLTESQLEVIEEALSRMLPEARRNMGESPNARGTALFELCKAYLELQVVTA